MDKKDFDTLDEAQAARDLDFAEHVKRDILPGLFLDLEHAIPGYFDLPDWEKFCGLMRTNEKHAHKGNALLLDFDETSDGAPMRGLVFPGKNLTYSATKDCGESKVTVFTPAVWTGGYGVEGNPITNSIDYFYSNMQKDYKALPVPYKVAMLAAYIRQYVIVRETDACRFAAGMSDTLPLMRWDAELLKAGNGQVFGWRVAIRDTTPTNDMAKHIARHLKNFADGAKVEPWGVLPDGKPRFADQGKRPRTRRTSTLLLEDFVYRYLPEHGYRLANIHPEGVKLTWEEAYIIFNDMHPGIYKDWDTFRKSYSNAKTSYGWEVHGG